MKTYNVVLGALLIVILGSVSAIGYSIVESSKGRINVATNPRTDIPSSSKALPVQNTHLKPQSDVMEVIQLTSDNMVVLNAAFDDQSVSQVMIALQRLSDASPNKTLYLVLNTPGGSVDSGLRLFSFVKALPNKVKTLTLFAASMGFQTVQNLDERLMLDSGTLMSHRAKFGLSGEAPGEFFSRLKWIMSMLNDLDAIASKRMGMSFDDYRKLIADEYWVYGKQAVIDGAADRVVTAKCSKQLLNQVTKETIQTFFGSAEVELSGCPLIPGYISLKFEGQEKHPEAMEYVKKMYSDKTGFVSKFITTNEWTKFQKSNDL